MVKVLDDYAIMEKTMLLIMIANFDYSTIVLETNRQYFVKKTSTQLINEGCLAGGASYNGRREAVIHQTAWRQKLPIPINTGKSIYAFPSESSKNFTCYWIFFQHVQSIVPFMKSKHESIIIFKNGSHIRVKESSKVLNNQMQRTAILILNFSSFIS